MPGVSRYGLIGCEVLRPETEALIDELRLADTIDRHWLEMGLHDHPERLHRELRERIAGHAGRDYAAILLLFGLCSRATADLTPPPDTRLVIPRVHDCVSLHLGSAETYLREHREEPGTFWFSRGFLHRRDGEPAQFVGLGATGGFILGEDGERRSVEHIRRDFIERYGEDNAEYLVETLLESWKRNYTRAVHLEWEGNPDLDADRAYIANRSSEYGWRCEARTVDLRLVRMLLLGDWPEEEFVVVRPGQRLAATNDESAMRVE